LDQSFREGVEGSFCKDCFKDKNKLKIYIEKQEKKKKEEFKKEKGEEEIKDKKIKEKVKNKTPIDVYAIIFLLYGGLIFSLANIVLYDGEANMGTATTLGAGFSLFLLPLLIYSIYLAHKRKKRFVNIFLIYLWLISFLNLFLFEYVIKTSIYVRFGIAIFFTAYLKLSKEINYAFYN